MLTQTDRNNNFDHNNERSRQFNNVAYFCKAAVAKYSALAYYYYYDGYYYYFQYKAKLFDIIFVWIGCKDNFVLFDW